MKCLAIVLLAVVTLAGCDIPLLRTPPPPLGAQIPGDQLALLLAGNSLVRSLDEVPPLVLYFDGDGEMRGLRSNNYKDRGTWRVDDDAVCGAWNNWYGTLASCWQVFQYGDQLTLKSTSRAQSFRATLAPGNVAQLQ